MALYLIMAVAMLMSFVVLFIAALKLRQRIHQQQRLTNVQRVSNLQLISGCESTYCSCDEPVYDASMDFVFKPTHTTYAYSNEPACTCYSPQMLDPLINELMLNPYYLRNNNERSLSSSSTVVPIDPKANEF
jgi:hypothetical protein